MEASKVAARRLTEQYEATGKLPAEQPLVEENGLSLFGARERFGETSLEGCLREALASIKPGDYLALLAYIERNPAHERLFNDVRRSVRDATRAATCLGFGPRFLHSTGQAYKGGPPSGVFVEITCDDAADVPVPGSRYTFGTVKQAQARGDFQVLAKKQPRAVHVHVSAPVEQNLEALAKLLVKATTAAGRAA